jgi:putative Mg2+ transporter-C (MgtC) family protein
MAAGAGLPLLAVGATAAHFLVTTGFPPVVHALRRRAESPTLVLDYLDGRGVLRTVLAVCTDNGWSVEGVAVDRESVTEEGHRVATVSLRLGGRRDLGSLAAEVAQLPDVRAVRTGVDDELDEQ